MNSAALKAHLELIQKLILDGTRLARASGKSPDTVELARTFGDGVRQEIRVFHNELPPAAIQITEMDFSPSFTAEELEVNREFGDVALVNPDPIFREADDRKRYGCIDRRAIRDALEWLVVLEKKLELSIENEQGLPTKSRQGRGQLKRSSTLIAKIRDRVIALHDAKFSYEEICKRLDEDKVERPPNTAWSQLTWSKAYNAPEYRQAVKAWLCRATRKNG